MDCSAKHPRVWIVYWPVSGDTPSAEQTLNTQSSLRRANACATGCVHTPNLFAQDLGAATVCNLPACLIGPKELHCVWASCACECVHARSDIFLLKWFYGFIGFYLPCWPKAVAPSFFSSSFSCSQPSFSLAEQPTVSSSCEVEVKSKDISVSRPDRGTSSCEANTRPVSPWWCNIAKQPFQTGLQNRTIKFKRWKFKYSHWGLKHREPWASVHQFRLN